MKFGLHTSGMNWALVFILQGCSTLTYMRVSEPIRLDAVLADSGNAQKNLPTVAVECSASLPGESSGFCKNIMQDIEKSQTFALHASDQEAKPDYRIKLQLLQKLEDGPGFWDYTFSLMTFSIYPQETRMFYEIRFTGSKTGSPDKITRSLRCHTIRRFGGLYKLGSLIADLFRSPDRDEADTRKEQQEASKDLYYFLKNSLDDLQLTREGDPA